MKKIKQLLKKYYVFLLFVVPFILIAINNKIPDNDIWFLLSLGRYVFSKGIPTIDPFTIHEGLNYVMQQWLSASFFWFIYDKFGKYALLVFIFVITIILFAVFYKLCKVVSDNKKISVILSVIAFCTLGNYIVMRPQIFTYLILLVEILLMELYVKKNNCRYLYIMPFLSLLLINLHASMWYMQFVFMLPFFVNCINLKKISIDKIRFKPLLLIMFFMIIAGFINPYGYNALLFIFKSYGLDSINKYVGEMKSPVFSSDCMKIAIICMILFIFILWYKKKKLFDIRHILFICGTYLMFCMHLKCYPYFCFVYFYSLAYGFKNFDINFCDVKNKVKIFYNKIFIALKNGVLIGTAIMLFLTLFVTLRLLWSSYGFYPAVLFDKDCEIMGDYIVENYELDDIRLYTTFNEGGYYMFRGIKAYIDPRAEVFFKVSNEKDDIFDEAMRVNNFDFDYDAFLEKYKFTHLIVQTDTFFDNYLQSNDNYEVKFVSYFDGDETQPYQNLYVLKNFEVE